MQLTRINVSTRQLRAFVALAELTQLHARRRADAPVAVGVQHADPHARGRASAAAVRPRHAQGRADGRRPAVPRRRARRLLRRLRHRAGGSAASTRRGGAAASRSRCCRRSPRAGCPTCWRRFTPRIRASSSTSPMRCRKTASSACARASADFALAAIRANTPELRTEPFCSDRFHLVCRRDHPLAKRAPAAPSPTSPAEPFVHLSRTSSVRQHVDAARCVRLQMNTRDGARAAEPPSPAWCAPASASAWCRR